MKTEYCDSCGEVEAVYEYQDNVNFNGLNTEIRVCVCEQCKAELQEAQYGKDYQVYFRSINRDKNNPLGI